MASSGSVEGQVTVGEANTNQASAPISSNVGIVDHAFQGQIKTVAAITKDLLLVGTSINKVRLIWVRGKDFATGAPKRVTLTVISSTPATLALPPSTEHLFINSDINAVVNITAVQVTTLDATATLIDFIIAGVT